MLHLIQKNPFQNQCFVECLKVASADDVFLLMLDGVYALQKADFLESGNQIFVLEPDMKARGLSLDENTLDNIKAIDYLDFVKTTESHHKVISWY